MSFEMALVIARKGKAYTSSFGETLERETINIEPVYVVDIPDLVPLLNPAVSSTPGSTWYTLRISPLKREGLDWKMTTVLPKEDFSLDERSRQLYEHFVPKNHPLRKIDEAIDFSFVRPLVEHLYEEGIGRPAEQPEQMWRLLFAQFYFNLSDEKIILQAHTDLALRRFIRLRMDEKPCHPTTLQKFRFDRLDEDTYLYIHFELLRQAEEKGLLKREERQIFDTSHVRSNTRIVSIPYLLMQARAKVIKEVKKIDEVYGQELGNFGDTIPRR